MFIHVPVVLVVEDEVLVRLIAAEMLTEAGFDVIEAEHAAAALLVLDARAADIRVLFTDVNMPGALDGLGLARHARHHAPWIASLVTSGKMSPSPAAMPAGSRFIAKPYRLAHLVDLVRQLANAG